MNSDALSRHYDQLRPPERLQLLLAATARDDQVERDRLMQSAPEISLRVPHHYGMGTALVSLSHLLFMRLMAIAAGYLVAYAEAVHSQGYEQFRDHWLEVLEQGYSFQIHLEGWRRFCAELNVEPALLWRHLPGWETIRQADELSGPQPGRRWQGAFTAEELARYRAGEEWPDSDAPIDPAILARHRPETAEAIAAVLHQTWQEKLERLDA